MRGGPRSGMDAVRELYKPLERLYQPSRGRFGLEENPNATAPRGDRFDLGPIDVWLLRYCAPQILP